MGVVGRLEVLLVCVASSNAQVKSILIVSSIHLRVTSACSIISSIASSSTISIISSSLLSTSTLLATLVSFGLVIVLAVTHQALPRNLTPSYRSCSYLCDHMRS